MIQLSILKITEYGPWTLKLGHDREHELQMFQASLYAAVQRHLSERGSLVFQNRSDEFFAVTNGLGLDDHIQVQQDICGMTETGLTVSIGYGASPFEANLKAYEGRRTDECLSRSHGIFGYVYGGSDTDVSIMHLDVDNLTSRRETDSPYEISSRIFGLYAYMSEYFQRYGSLSFFMGGDNFMVVASDEAKAAVHDFIGAVREDRGITLNCGIGSASTARRAAELATKSLDTIREIRDSGGDKPAVYETC